MSHSDPAKANRNSRQNKQLDPSFKKAENKQNNQMQNKKNNQFSDCCCPNNSDQ